MPWQALLDEDAVANLLAHGYSRFARPICEGLAVFLGGLPEDRQLQILRAQAALGPDAAMASRLYVLARHCPALHKLGQVLARDSRIASELRIELQALESLPPSVPLAIIEETLQRELGDLVELGVRLRPPALAEASVSVVIPFEWRDAQSRGFSSRHGVFKVLKPRIEEELEIELGLLEAVGGHLDEECERLQLPRIEYRESFQQIRERLTGEVRLAEEQAHLRAARRVFRGVRDVEIPALFPFNSRRVTSMQFLRGVKITDHTREAGLDARLAEALVSSLIACPILSRDPESLFHSDPHAGNLLVTRTGKLAILDWSLTGRLSKAHRVAMARAMLAAMSLDEERLTQWLERLTTGPLRDRSRLQEVARTWLRRLHPNSPTPLPGLTWFTGLLDELVHSAAVRVDAELMLFRKMLLSLEGVLTDLGASAMAVDLTLLRQVLAQFVAEWPWRCVSLPISRDFGTHLSTWDLTDAAIRTPWNWFRRYVEAS